MSIVSYSRLSFVVSRRIVCRNGIFLVFFIWCTAVVMRSNVITWWGNGNTWLRGITNTSRWKITNREGCFSSILQMNVGIAGIDFQWFCFVNQGHVLISKVAFFINRAWFQPRRNGSSIDRSPSVVKNSFVGSAVRWCTQQGTNRVIRIWQGILPVSQRELPGLQWALYSFPYSTVEFLALPISPGVETCSSARSNAVWVQPRFQLVGLKRWPSIRMNVRAHSKNRRQLRQTLNDGFRGYIRTRKAKGNLEYSSTTVIKYVTGSAWQQACEVQVQSFKNLRSFEKSSNIWSNEVGLYLLTFFTLRCHLSYVSESEWKMFGTNEVTHPRNAWMTESNVKTAQAVLLNITTVSSSQTVGTNIFYPRAMHNIVAIRRQLQPPPRDFDVFDFVGVSHVLHEWHTLLVSYKGKMLSNKQMPPLSKCFYHSVGLLFNGRMALFARR